MYLQACVLGGSDTQMAWHYVITMIMVVNRTLYVIHVNLVMFSQSFGYMLLYSFQAQDMWFSFNIKPWLVAYN